MRARSFGLWEVHADLDDRGIGIPRLWRGFCRRQGRDRSLARPACGFQEAALFPWLTVLENVSFGLKIAGVAEAERRERAMEAIKMVHLSKFINAHPHELSGGMKQRAAIARALVMDPKILLMDEPFAALDAQTRQMLMEELQDIWQKTKKTIL